MALGIGAKTAIFSFMDSILLRSLPVADPESLVVLNWHSKDPRQAGIDKRTPHVMHSMDGSTYNDPKTGLTAGIFPYAAFELMLKKDAVFPACSPTIRRRIAPCKSKDRPIGPAGFMFPANTFEAWPYSPPPAV